MSENYEYCYYCGKVKRIGLEDKADEYYTCEECLEEQSSGETK